MASPLTIKAFLQYPEGLELGSSPSIRRFKLKEKGGDSDGDLYSRLQDALPAVFPELKGLNYSLFWKDGDDDLVLISSLAELQAGVDGVTDKVFRLYILVELDLEETGDSDFEPVKEDKKVSKRVRFQRSGYKLRRKIRRKRWAAWLDMKVISQDFRKAVRFLVEDAHSEAIRRAAGKPEKPKDEARQSAIDALTPEVQAFVKQVVEDWHSRLAQKRPKIVAKRVRYAKRTLPEGLQKDHFRWFCHFLARWHRRHAGRCEAMSGWSSGETGDDTSGDEETLLTKPALKKAGRDSKEGAPAAAAGAATDSEQTDAEETSDFVVPKDFRKAVRALMSDLHRNKPKPDSKQDNPSLAALTPEARAFVQKLADDWHTKLATKRPRVVAKRIKKEKRTLPSGLETGHFQYLCRFMKRWHRRHAGKCQAMAGWSSGAESGTEEEGAGEEAESKEEKAAEDPAVKEFRKGVRGLVMKAHKKAKSDKQPEDEADLQPAVEALAPKTRDFVLHVIDEWHGKLAKKNPRVVAKRIKRKQRSLPAGFTEENFAWFCRFMARWHRKHAGKCDVMSGWSSGETGDDTSGDEQVTSPSRPRRSRRVRRVRPEVVEALSESEATDCMDSACQPVSKEFRSAAGAILRQLHRPAGKKGDATASKPSLLSPELQQFLARFSSDWHEKLTGHTPRAASRQMQGLTPSLPASLERDQYRWLCCFMARWHRKHPDSCDAMTPLVG